MAERGGNCASCGLVEGSAALRLPAQSKLFVHKLELEFRVFRVFRG
jgi:hypothetical protein